MDKHKTAQRLVSNYNTDSLDRSWRRQTLGGQQSARRDWWRVVGQTEVVATYKLKFVGEADKVYISMVEEDSSFYCYSMTLTNFVLIIL